MGRKIVFESRFDDVELARLFGAAALQLSLALEFWQAANLTSTHRKIVLIFTQDNSAQALDDFDPKIAVVRIRPQKNSVLLDSVRAATEEAARKFGWNSGAWASTWQRVTDEACAVYGVVKGSRKNSPDGKTTAEVSFKFEGQILFSLNISTPLSGEPFSIPFAQFPASLANVDEIGELKWEGPAEIRISRQGTDDYWSWNANESRCQFHFARANDNDAHALYDLGVMYAKGHVVLPDEEQAKVLLDRSAAQGFKKAINALKGFKA